MIKTEVKTLKDNKVELTVEVSLEKFKESIGSAYRSISKQAKIPGFRKGKVPAKIIDNYYGKAYVLQQAIETDLPKYYSQAVHDSAIKPIDRPDVEILTLEEDKSLKFKAQVEVEPELKLPPYKDLKAELKKEKVKPEDIEAQLNIIKNRFAEVKPAEGKVADSGDYLLINFEGKVDGNTFEGGSAQNFLLELGSNTFLPEFEKQLTGSKAGDIKNIEVEIPPQNPNKEIAGKKANFQILVKEVKVKSLPELNDDFVKESAGFETLSDLKKEIKSDLQKALDKEAEGQFKLALLKQLAEKSKVSITDTIINQTIEEMIEEMEVSLKNQGMTMEKFLESSKKSQEDLKKELREPAIERAKEQLALKTLIEKEKITVGDEELNKAVDEFSKRREKSFTRKELEEKGLIGYLKSNIIYTKALDFLAEKTKKEIQK